MKLDIGKTPHALVGLCLAIMVLMVLKADSEPIQERLRVVYLGRSTAGDDPPYQRFVEALNQLPQTLKGKVATHHVPALTPTSPRYEDAVDEAIMLRPHVIVAPSTATAQAVRKRALNVPVVFTSFSDPVQSGVITSTKERQEPFTGVWMADELDAKRLEVLRDAYPHIRTVGVLVDAIWDRNAQTRQQLPQQGHALGLEVTVMLAENKEEAARLLEHPGSKAFDAWCIPPSGLSSLNADFIVDTIGRWGKPVIIGRALSTVKNAPLSYAYDPGFRWPAVVDLLARVLQGEPAGSIPIQRPTRTVLAVRQSPGSGLPAPSTVVMQRADQVVE